MNKKFVFLSFIAGIALLFACQKQDVLNQEANEEAILKSAQVALADDKLETALTEAAYESDFYSGIVKLLSVGHHGGMKFGFRDFHHYKMGKGPDVVISNTTDTYPKTITLDYGDGTEIHHGRVLKGVITIEISAAPRTDGATKKITFKNFWADSITVNGTSTSVFKGDNKTSAVENYTENVVFTYDDGTEITWAGEKKRDWVEGLGTDTVRMDDVIKITGKATAAIKGGSTYLKQITVPLVRKGSCRYIVQGVIQLTVDNTLISSVDYGNGECDETATLTKDGTTTTLDLTKKEPPHFNKNK